jgi:SAM-dependent methyltransferase
MLEAEGPNASQIEYWNEVSGPKWVRLGDDIDIQIAPLGREVMDRAAIRTGERILDVGCGCGHTSLELAERVGPKGSVVGLDISGPMLESARARASTSDSNNIAFVQADAQTYDFGTEAVDRIFSRFGVMFFSDPPAAFHNLLGALRPGGSLDFACWQEIGKNPWMMVPTAAVAQHVEMPPPPKQGGPGPFSMADPDLLREILEGAGFKEVRIEAHERKANISGGKSLDETVDFIVQMGPAGAAFRDSSPEIQRRATAAVRDAIEPFETESGIWLDSGIWIVSARRSD